jgi:hypothetical protein
MAGRMAMDNLSSEWWKWCRYSAGAASRLAALRARERRPAREPSGDRYAGRQA